MTNEQILCAAGEIDEHFLAECAAFSEERRRNVHRRRAFRRVAVIAAVVAGAALLTGAALTVSRVWFPSSFARSIVLSR